MKPIDSRSELLALADQCVKCGLCLPVCPTYGLARHEADSPRGRIALVQGWARGSLELTPKLVARLDACLGCRACESVCPSLVAYGRLAETARAWRVARLPAGRRAIRWLAARLLSLAPTVRLLARLARLDRASPLSCSDRSRHPSLLADRPRPASNLADDRSAASGRPLPDTFASAGTRGPLAMRRLLPRLLPGLQPYRRLARVLADTARSVPPRRPPAADLELFLGCSGASAQGAAMRAALEVCAALGLRVRVASAATCCGALARHNGFPDLADRQRARALRLHTVRPLVGLSSACIAALREAPAPADPSSIPDAGPLELCDYLDLCSWPAGLKLRPLPATVLVHEPCTHRLRLGGNAAVHRLLARIPELRVLPLPSGAGCCGGAGTYPLRQPELAQALLEDSLSALGAPDTPDPDWILTTSPGCALHLAAGLRESGRTTRVGHPVELLARQIRSVIGSVPDPADVQAPRACSR